MQTDNNLTPMFYRSFDGLVEMELMHNKVLSPSKLYLAYYYLHYL